MRLQPRLHRVTDLVESEPVDSIVVTTPENVAYYLGHARFGSGRTVIVADGEAVHCLVPEGEEAFLPDVDATVETYPGYRIDTTADPLETLAERVSELVAGTVGVEGGTTHATGVSTGSVPYVLVEALDVDATRNVTPAILAQRAVKDDADCEALREALRVTEAGIESVREALEPGVSEVGLLGAATDAMERAAGGHVDVFCDLISGEKTASIGCPAAVAGERPVSTGDLVIVELIPTVNGYTGSTARTFSVGESSERQRDCHAAVVDALEAAIAAVEPGVRASTVYETMIDSLAADGLDAHFPHHAGHGLGIDVHEPPLIVPGNDAELAAGNVLALEPGVYDETWGGIRVEDVVRVTEDGAERLTTLEYDL